MMRHFTRLVTILAILFICLALKQTRTLAQDEPDVVRIVMGPQLGAGNTAIAYAEGYFADQNIEIEFVEVAQNSDAATIALLLEGEIDVLQTFISPAIINGILRGGEIRAFAVSGYNDPDRCSYNGFVVAPDKVESFDPAALGGARVALPLFAEYYLDTVLREHGMTLDDVTIEDMPSAARPEALVNGVLDLIWLGEPSYTQMHQSLGLEMVLGSAQMVPNESQGVLFFGPRMLNRDDDLAIRYLTAYLQGSHQFNEGPTDRNLEVMNEMMGLDAETLDGICWIAMRDNGELITENVVNYQNWLYEQELIDDVIEIDALYDPAYVREAYQRVQAIQAEADGS